MCNYRDIIQKQFGMDMDNVKGAGAAGGLGAALMVFLNGTLKSGIETVLDLLDFDRRWKGRCSSYRRGSYRLAVRIWKSHAGRWYTLQGAWYTGGGNCWKYGQRAEDIFEYGIESMITTINGVMTLPEALDHAEELYLGAARRLFRMLRAGRKLSVAVNGVNSNDSHKRAE